MTPAGRPQPARTWPKAVWGFLTRSPIRRKFLVVIFVSGAIPALVVLALSHLALRRVIAAGMGQYLLGRAEAIANAIDSQIQAEMQATAALASGESVRQLLAAPGSSLATLPPAAERSLREKGFCFLADAHGRVLARAVEDPLLEQELTPALWEQVARRPRGVHMTEHFVPGGAPGWLVIIAPVPSRGTPVYVVRRVPMADIVARVPHETAPEFYTAVVNRHGLPVGGVPLSAQTRALFSRLLSRRSPAAGGWDTGRVGDALQVLAFRQLRGLGVMANERLAQGNWSVLCGFDLGALLEPVAIQLWTTAGIGLVAVLLFLLVGAALTRQLIQPLRQLRTAVEAIAAGRLDQRLDIRTGDEIEDLAQHINAMAARLAETLDAERRLAAELEAKVEKRSAALLATHRRLVQTEKFAATGRLASSVAHEINNPLGIIKNYLQIISDNLESARGGRRATDPNREAVAVIREEIDRIARIVRNLLVFYRGAAGEAPGAPANINDEIQSILRLVEASLHKNGIALELQLAPDLPPVTCNADLTRQVFLNLVRNAEDAMAPQRRGTLTITTAREGDDVVATVADTGPGIAPEHLDLIFDPFFTTKAESGTGLGLSVTYGILQSIGGSIEVESTPGQGARFRLRFPVAEQRAGAG